MLGEMDLCAGHQSPLLPDTPPESDPSQSSLDEDSVHVCVRAEHATES